MKQKSLTSQKSKILCHCTYDRQLLVWPYTRPLQQKQLQQRQWAQQLVGTSMSTTYKFGRAYTEKQMDAAIEEVHWGASTLSASEKYLVPRRTLGYKLLQCKKGHPGKCTGAYIHHPDFSNQAF